MLGFRALVLVLTECQLSSGLVTKAATYPGDISKLPFCTPISSATRSHLVTPALVSLPYGSLGDRVGTHAQRLIVFHFFDHCEDVRERVELRVVEKSLLKIALEIVSARNYVAEEGRGPKAGVIDLHANSLLVDGMPWNV